MSVREIFAANLLVKFLALFLAVVLCLFVWLETGAEEDVVLPLRLVNLPAGLRVQAPGPVAITLRLSGARIMLLRQRWQGQPLTLDLNGAKPGILSLAGLERQLHLAPGVKVLWLQPANLQLTLAGG